jgi:hypothetical protein
VNKDVVDESTKAKADDDTTDASKKARLDVLLFKLCSSLSSLSSSSSVAVAFVSTEERVLMSSSGKLLRRVRVLTLLLRRATAAVEGVQPTIAKVVIILVTVEQRKSDSKMPQSSSASL